jgi:hypothetical protein
MSMNILLAALLLVSVISCSRQQGSHGAADSGSTSTLGASSKKVVLLTVTDGLSPEHLREAPLLEKVARIPASEHGAPGTTVASRVYGDGAYYMLVSELNGAPVSPRWSKLSSLEPAGVERLKALFARVCATADTRRQDDSGDVEYRVTSPRCTRTFVNGLPSNRSPSVEADTVINANMKPIPAKP